MIKQRLSSLKSSISNISDNITMNEINNNNSTNSENTQFRLYGTTEGNDDDNIEPNINGSFHDNNNENIDHLSSTSLRSNNINNNTNFLNRLYKYDIKELIFVIIFIILCHIFINLDLINLNERNIPYQLLNDGSYVRNSTNNEEFNGDTISVPLVLLLSFIIPFIIQLFISKLYGIYGDIHSTLCIYLLSYSITYIITDIIKNYVGYLRPIFYDLCQPNDTYDECISNNDHSTIDAHKSFPSGHASLSFSGLTLLTLYIHNRFGIPSIKVFKSITINNTSTLSNEEGNIATTNNTIEQHYIIVYKTNKNDNVLKYRIISLLSLLPMGLALFIAITRVHDNRHFPADIIAGSILGFSISYFINSLWFH